MEKWARKVISEIQSCEDLKALKVILLHVKNKLEFNHVVFGTQLPQTLTNMSNFVITDYPNVWMERYTEQGYVKYDPVVKHCRASQEPYCWDRFSEVTELIEIEFLKDAAKYGLVGGVSVSLHDNNGGVSIFTLATDYVIKSSSEKCFTTSMYMTALLPYLYQAVTRLSQYRQLLGKKPTLTDREMDCLIWSAEGKTAEEISHILSIKSSTVAFHLKNVNKKLNASNRNQAISQAILSGIISPEYSPEGNPATYYY